MLTRKLFYIDTNCLIFARHYLLCRDATIDEAHFPQGIRTGKTIVDALELCDQKQEQVDLRTSKLVNFEINNRFRTSQLKRVFLDYGIPLEAVDGRPQDILANLDGRPEELRLRFDEKLKESQEWYRTWDYRRILVFESLEPQIFSLAEVLPFISPGIDLMDSLHVATALHIGANYFVSNDGDLRNHARRIIEDAVSQHQLPNGEQYPLGEELDGAMKPIKPNEFFDTVRQMRLYP